MGDLNASVQTVLRKIWDRATKVRIDNAYNTAPVLTFEIHTITTDNDVQVGDVPKSLLVVNYNPDEVYPLLNPIDGSVIDPIGGNHNMLQAQLFSLFTYKTTN